MSSWTVERVAALAPDAASASAGQGLASPKKWVEVGASERAVWGLCQGSGKDPYQTRVDLSGPSFKCSCPSRKFPCKHGLGLMFVYAKDPAAFKAKKEPGWVSEWLEAREERAEKKAEKAAAPPKPVDEAAQAKRAAKRDDRVRDGVAACRLWLEDLVRRGLAAARSDKDADWEKSAARMVDAQAPGLAGFIRRLPETLASGEGWEVRTLEAMGRLHLLLEAFERVDQLPADLAGDVRTALGYTQSKEEALAGPALADRWSVVGQSFEEEERLLVRRSWLWGARSARPALIVDFVPLGVGSATLDPMLAAGVEFEGEVAFYPSRAPLRALVKSRGASGAVAALPVPPAEATPERNLRRHAEAVAANPWLARWPFLLAGARPVRAGDGWAAAVGDDRPLPLKPGFVAGLGIWRWLSISSGAPVSLFGEWDGEFLTPLGLLSAAGYTSLASRWAA